MKDYYATLGVDRSASPDDIKKAFRKLSMQHHPDKGGDESKFKEINEAYSVLYNEDKRRQYDNPNPFDNVFRGFGGPPRPKKPDFNSPRDGQFIAVETTIPLKTFVFGGVHTVKLSYHEGCSTCSGKGFINGEHCSFCNGEGYVQQVQRRPGFMSSSMSPCPHCRGLGITGTDKCLDCKGAGNIYVADKEFSFDLQPGAGLGTKHILNGAGRTGLNGGRRGDVGIIVVGLKPVNLNKITSEKVEQLKTILEELD